jgi:opacity protein-like surface antigen
VRALVACVILAAAVPAHAQSIEVSGLFGYTTASEIARVADDVDELSFAGSFTWGAGVTYFLTERLAVEGLFMQQPTAVRLTSGEVSTNVMDLTINQVLANVVFRPAVSIASLQPFIFGGAGVSTLTARGFESESKFAWTIGGGVKWMPATNVGTRMHVRYKMTNLGDEDRAPCEPFGFCEDALPQIEIAAGVVFRF